MKESKWKDYPSPPPSAALTPLLCLGSGIFFLAVPWSLDRRYPRRRSRVRGQSKRDYSITYSGYIKERASCFWFYFFANSNLAHMQYVKECASWFWFYFCTNRNLAFVRVAEGNMEGAFAGMARCAEAIERFPGLCRYAMWLVALVLVRLFVCTLRYSILSRSPRWSGGKRRYL